MANTSLPCSTASRAVISEPDCRAASTTSVARDRPEISRLRWGKLAARGGVPSGYSLNSKPCCAIRCASLRWLFGIDPVESGADYGNGGQLGRLGTLQRAFVGCTIHAQCQAGNDGQAGLGQCAGKIAGIGSTLGCWIPAADDCNAGGTTAPVAVEQGVGAQYVQQQRRVFNVQQGLGIAGVGQRQDVVLLGGRCKPSPCGVQLPRAVGWGLEQRLGLPRAHAAF